MDSFPQKPEVSEESTDDSPVVTNPYQVQNVPRGDSSVYTPMNLQSLRLKRIGVLSAGMFMGAMGAVGGLFVGVMMALVMLLGAADSGNDFAVGLGAGFVMLLVAPLTYGGIGFVAGVMNAIVYNLLAGVVGGIQMDFERT